MLLHLSLLCQLLNWGKQWVPRLRKKSEELRFTSFNSTTFLRFQLNSTRIWVINLPQGSHLRKRVKQWMTISCVIFTHNLQIYITYTASCFWANMNQLKISKLNLCSCNQTARWTQILFSTKNKQKKGLYKINTNLQTFHWVNKYNILIAHCK